MITCTITISRNSLVKKDAENQWCREWMQEHHHLPGIHFQRRNKNNRWIDISGFRIDDSYHFFPLWPQDGHTSITVSVEEYNRLVALAPVIADKTMGCDREVLRDHAQDARDWYTLK